ncbi:hypothetical protein FCL47_10955 [Desulfopila sp. IMCC35006]|uniref:hypothetical protein n=1 Tax=Desulfopila sp. IMCC35006 TaxID=2569542 RepID=UPI0010AB599B|nr:hypothetical protein [Desulfopila sp. IMCC35006]TKB26245.1 hypothetical protein FCL47_10955 [Desulfopila sp. IMCC35006]
MILHPGVLALITGSAITLLMLCYAAINGAMIFFAWNYNSSSASQLALERKTYLISTLVNYGLGFQIIAFVLFIFTMDDIHRLFVGAMCATGSLNANPVGWYALLSKIIVFFLSGFWIALNYIDQQAEQYPLVRLKYALLGGIVPCIGIDFTLQLTYFLGLEPDIITSCCGSLFGSGGESTASSLAALPVFPAMVAFYSLSIILISVMVLNLAFQAGVFRYLLALFSALFFVLAIVSMISFISVYIYELPTHHCPFDILQQEYNFVGYPLYLTLFGGVYFGMLPGLFQPLKNTAGLAEIVAGVEKKWVQCSMISCLCFIAFVTYAICLSKLTYFL